ncbi:hypothetical protein J2Y67_001387 [Neobacillus niacini]|nr:hypothetical protein [Neobacillus niacini]
MSKEKKIIISSLIVSFLLLMFLTLKRNLRQAAHILLLPGTTRNLSNVKSTTLLLKIRECGALMLYGVVHRFISLHSCSTNKR